MDEPRYVHLTMDAGIIAIVLSLFVQSEDLQWKLVLGGSLACVVGGLIYLFMAFCIINGVDPHE